MDETIKPKSGQQPLRLTDAEYVALERAIDYYWQIVGESEWPGWRETRSALHGALRKIRKARVG